MATTYSNSLSFLMGRNLMDMSMAQVIDPILRGTNLLDIIPFASPSLYLKDTFWELEETATSNVQNLSLNQLADYGTQNVGKRKEITMQRYGDAFQLSSKLFKDTSELDMARKTEAFLRMDKLMRRLANDVINGIPNSEGLGITGLKSQAPTFSLGASGLQIGSSASTMQEFISLVNKAKRRVDTSAGQKLMLITNEAITDSIEKGYRQIGASNGGLYQDDWLNREVQKVADIPVVTVKNGDTANAILPQTETQGGSNDASSIYLVAINANKSTELLPYTVGTGVSFLTQYNDLFDIDTEQEFSLTKVQIDGFFNMKVPTNSALRLIGARE